MRTLTLLIFCFALAYVGSYAAFRWSHGEPPATLGRVTVTYRGDQQLLYRLFYPLTHLDARLTGSVSKY